MRSAVDSTRSSVMPLGYNMLEKALMKLVSATFFLILIAASSASSLSGQNDQAVANETNYKKVNGFSGYLTLDDYPYDHVQRWLDSY